MRIHTGEEECMVSGYPHHTNKKWILSMETWWMDTI